ncbi:hypothetical protein B0T16DRAFT_444395 [Cercophora newfieldiana]|uniref:RRM domain-containing protein n=1 Tax=Cercophora newfieldiana TaxID=92897 RepID=A0AA39Y996_9PEZI|nr:hypothetical protein B0T16DRAFT_444395 [Cercophora newfieldiana]
MDPGHAKEGLPPSESKAHSGASTMADIARRISELRVHIPPPMEVPRQFDDVTQEQLENHLHPTFETEHTEGNVGTLDEMMPTLKMRRLSFQFIDDFAYILSSDRRRRRRVSSPPPVFEGITIPTVDDTPIPIPVTIPAISPPTQAEPEPEHKPEPVPETDLQAEPITATTTATTTTPTTTTPDTRPDTRALFIMRLPHGVTASDILACIRDTGKVRSLRIIRNPSPNTGRRFAPNAELQFFTIESNRRFFNNTRGGFFVNGRRARVTWSRSLLVGEDWPDTEYMRSNSRVLVVTGSKEVVRMGAIRALLREKGQGLPCEIERVEDVAVEKEGEVGYEIHFVSFAPDAQMAWMLLTDELGPKGDWAEAQSSAQSVRRQQTIWRPSTAPGVPKSNPGSTEPRPERGTNWVYTSLGPGRDAVWEGRSPEVRASIHAIHRTIVLGEKIAQQPPPPDPLVQMLCEQASSFAHMDLRGGMKEVPPVFGGVQPEKIHHVAPVRKVAPAAVVAGVPGFVNQGNFNHSRRSSAPQRSAVKSPWDNPATRAAWDKTVGRAQPTRRASQRRQHGDAMW